MLATKKQKQSKEQLMKALKNIVNREADPQTATGPSYNFLDKIVKKAPTAMSQSPSTTADSPSASQLPPSHTAADASPHPTASMHSTLPTPACS